MQLLLSSTRRCGSHQFEKQPGRSAAHRRRRVLRAVGVVVGGGGRSSSIARRLTIPGGCGICVAITTASSAAAEPDLLDCADQQVVHFVVEYRRHFHVLAAVHLRQRLALCSNAAAPIAHTGHRRDISPRGSQNIAKLRKLLPKASCSPAPSGPREI